MPNSYRYFESGEVSDERLFLEIELFKRCDRTDLNGIDWSAYDTPFLRTLAQSGIDQVHDELIRREMIEDEKNHQNFIEQCLRRPVAMDERQEVSKRSWSLIFILISLHLVVGYFLYEYVHHGGKHPFQQSLNRPLTARRRHLSFNDDFFIVLLTTTMASVVAGIIVATRYNRWILLIGILVALILLFVGLQKAKQIVMFLSKFRESRWSTDK